MRYVEGRVRERKFYRTAQRHQYCRTDLNNLYDPVGGYMQERHEYAINRGRRTDTVYGTLTKRKTKRRCTRRDYYISRRTGETLADRWCNIRASTDVSFTTSTREGCSMSCKVSRKDRC